MLAAAAREILFDELLLFCRRCGKGASYWPYDHGWTHFAWWTTENSSHNHDRRHKYAKISRKYFRAIFLGFLYHWKICQSTGNFSSNITRIHRSNSTKFYVSPVCDWFCSHTHFACIRKNFTKPKERNIARYQIIQWTEKQRNASAWTKVPELTEGKTTRWFTCQLLFAENLSSVVWQCVRRMLRFSYWSLQWVRPRSLAYIHTYVIRMKRVMPYTAACTIHPRCAVRPAYGGISMYLADSATSKPRKPLENCFGSSANLWCLCCDVLCCVWCK